MFAGVGEVDVEGETRWKSNKSLHLTVASGAGPHDKAASLRSFSLSTFPSFLIRTRARTSTHTFLPPPPSPPLRYTLLPFAVSPYMINRGFPISSTTSHIILERNPCGLRQTFALEILLGYEFD
jgi:hypothetical protein